MKRAGFRSKREARHLMTDQRYRALRREHEHRNRVPERVFCETNKAAQIATKPSRAPASVGIFKRTSSIQGAVTAYARAARRVVKLGFRCAGLTSRS